MNQLVKVPQTQIQEIHSEDVTHSTLTDNHRWRSSSTRGHQLHKLFIFLNQSHGVSRKTNLHVHAPPPSLPGYADYFPSNLFAYPLLAGQCLNRNGRPSLSGQEGRTFWRTGRGGRRGGGLAAVGRSNSGSRWAGERFPGCERTPPKRRRTPKRKCHRPMRG